MRVAMIVFGDGVRHWNSGIHIEMRFISGILVIVTLGLGLGETTNTPLRGAEPAAFPEGTRWCALGDGLTQAGKFSGWIALFYSTRFPQRSLEWSNAGLLGDTLDGALNRFSWDVEPTRPTVVSVLFGSNDIHRAFVEGSAAGRSREQILADLASGHRRRLLELVERIQSLGATAVLFSSPPYSDYPDRPAGPPEAFARLAELTAAVAKETDAVYVDLHGPLAPKEGGALPAADEMAFAMACLFLQAQRASAEVATLTIDLSAGRFLAGNSTVENVFRSETDLTFSWTANALPLPGDSIRTRSPAGARLLAEISREVLTVSSLRAGRWELRIDGDSVGIFTSEELAGGVNLAVRAATPQYKQAQDVARLLWTGQSLVADNVRSVALVEHRLLPDAPRPLSFETVKSALEARRPEMLFSDTEQSAFDLYEARKSREAVSRAGASRLIAQVRRAAQPQKHLYSLRIVR